MSATARRAAVYGRQQLAFADDQPEHSTESLLAEGNPNPRYVEYMMGYKDGWTTK